MPKFTITLADGSLDELEADEVIQDGKSYLFTKGKHENKKTVAYFPMSKVQSIKDSESQS